MVGLGDGDTERPCEEARQQLGGDTVCQLANYLFPQVCVGLCCLQQVFVAGCHFVCEPATQRKDALTHLRTFSVQTSVLYAECRGAGMPPLGGCVRKQLGGNTVCQLANYLFPQVR
jgi:hypothetical protein